eukprot:3390868-Amphidinium_carterae.1
MQRLLIAQEHGLAELRAQIEAWSTSYLSLAMVACMPCRRTWQLDRESRSAKKMQLEQLRRQLSSCLVVQNETPS